ncbi:MAG: hypothetical protein CMM67_12005 [Rhodospirillaceae bacterium]|nr:hypothetical protein [Rhodospirillaceae bacterium]MAV88952.1 hypothetical protein [Rhodospirillaceae bacterium]OUT77399.1 MAG: hypothetical protein CBB83_09425 [Rhodospirillaceae bacterium TMED23]|tara:strand:- start:80 stop:463 length:384 start_codon:yes stop_codon:yes gene_type:complete
MQPYIVFFKKDTPEKLMVIKDGFNWLAFITAPIWAAYNKLWSSLVALILVLSFLGSVLIILGFGFDGLMVAYLSVIIIFGWIANDLKIRHLKKGGYTYSSVLYGESKNHIIAIFYRNKQKYISNVSY